MNLLFLVINLWRALGQQNHLCVVVHDLSVLKVAFLAIDTIVGYTSCWNASTLLSFWLLWLPCELWHVMVELSFVQTERQVSRWFVQCLREQSMLLEVIFLYYAYFEMAPEELLAFAKMFKEQGFGMRQTNRHLVDESMDHLVDRIG